VCVIASDASQQVSARNLCFSMTIKNAAYKRADAPKSTSRSHRCVARNCHLAQTLSPTHPPTSERFDYTLSRDLIVFSDSGFSTVTTYVQPPLRCSREDVEIEKN